MQLDLIGATAQFEEFTELCTCLDKVPSDLKQLIVWPFSKNCNDDFQKQVAIAVKALTREYYQMF